MNKWLKLLLFSRLCEGEGEGSGGGGGTSGSGTSGEGTSDQPSFEDLLARFDKLESDNKALREQNATLFNEAKKAKLNAKTKEDEERKLKDQKAREEGNFKALLDQAEQGKNEVQEKFNTFIKEYKSDKAYTEALRIARELTDPNYPQNAEILAELIKGRLDYEIETKKYLVLDENLQETYASLDDFKKEVENNRRFATLLKSSQRSGGGAGGSKGGALGSKQLTRTEFERLNPMDKSQRMKDGWTVVD